MEKGTAPEVPAKCKPFFINLILKNKKEVVAQKVNEKAGLSSGGFFGKAAGFAANKMIKDEAIIGKLSENLIDGVRKAIADMGITASIENKFQQGSFVVIRLQIEDIELMKLITTAKGQEFASHFGILLDSVSHLGMGDSVSQKVHEKIFSSINEGMMAKFSELIPAKMKEKGLDVECVTRAVEEQADFFYDTLQSLNH